MKEICYWMTPYARHEIPEAVLWLAERAERKATGRWMWRCVDPQAFESFSDMADTVWWKVIEEWGKWREAQDKAEYEAACAE